MARNKLAGKSTGKSESSKYFASHPEARAKKNAYNKEYHSTSERIAYRSKLNEANRKAGSKVGDGKDMSHGRDGSLKKEDQSKNRARNGKGDNPRLRK